MKRFLILSDGTVLEGQALGADATTVGEVVFNTGMTGYQEILTDPSYAGQIVLLTYPLIGNYGINDDDFESDRLQPAGLIVKEACDAPSNWRSTRSIDALMRERGLTGVQGLDTRSITKRIRTGGVVMGAVTDSIEEGRAALAATAAYDDTDFVFKVTTKAPYKWGRSGKESVETPDEPDRPRLVMIDCGLKFNILRRFWAAGCRPIVLPATVTADEVLAWQPGGVCLSPGPGDPARLGSVIQAVRDLLGKTPIFGICLGNQLLCHAVGGRTFKLKFGHRGSNHPVKDLASGRVTITSQNHGYAVDPDSLRGTRAEVTQLNLNDGTVEGIRLKDCEAMSIQYHPEAAPGPWDSRPYFTEFVERLRAGTVGV
ncbi:MAG: glutamine-hydrolyzing carbamoyl-phosphate synthase small subunit [Fimbriimonas ginsengisoli]|uniref:Carbamoyl phosphate synthase small chain n=1 Tax=Fimbriimonas ginsengisoli TaxID=1005039 RepID=A0A931PWB6_FIMGI|nr:glutamine-hydrolyzing carbamoyl-phosphate synthase small subunit [Fimbriimonas ginsengisoli]